MAVVEMASRVWGWWLAPELEVFLNRRTAFVLLLVAGDEAVTYLGYEDSTIDVGLLCRGKDEPKCSKQASDAPGRTIVFP